ncbi:MAG TPA: HRDC domain-containing protein [Bdellovibrionota bacterium]|jgi:ribonuclease D|nr:HRDC domain-containing protein [Bdellovibrionota bacterium]
MITQRDELEAVAQELLSADWIAVDTEFIRETSFFPDLQIVQLATRNKAWLLDVQAFRTKGEGQGPNRRRLHYLEARKLLGKELEPLARVLEDRKVIKVFHAAQGDQECLYTAMGAIGRNSFDTAVAASLAGYGEGVGLANLMSQVLKVNLKKGHARTNWAQRPLPQQLQDYAVQDVDRLVELAQTLADQLTAMKRLEWAFELSAKWEDHNLYDPRPEELADSLYRGGRVGPDGYGVLLELAKWREERVRELNVPRKWLADDTVLMDIARVRPRDMDHLRTFRGLNRGEVNRHGELLLDLIAKGLSGDAASPPARRRRTEPPSANEARSMDLLKAYVALLADDKRIAVKNLLPSAQMLALIRTEATTVEGLVEDDVMGREAARLIGEEVLEFLRGKVALSLENGQVKVVKV